MIQNLEGSAGLIYINLSSASKYLLYMITLLYIMNLNVAVDITVLITAADVSLYLHTVCFKLCL